MYLWIVTIGSSDVQLISNEANRAKGRTEKQRSDKVWSYWYTDDLRADCYDISFEPKQTFSSKEEAYRIPPRILGRVYQASDESRQEEIWDYLTFPLLDNFVQALKNEPTPEAIAVLLTDQSTIFESDRQRKSNSPYWQDTCELQPILQNYFVDKFPDSLCEFTFLTPNSEAESLDNWDAVLDLVLQAVGDLEFETEPQTVYVSHQAGTPAISSAVQFASLATFGDRTRFLVSSENQIQPSRILSSSSYLKGIRKQEAKTLLERSDYPGVQAIVEPYLQDDDTKVLLNAAILWNSAKFDEFANELQKLSDQKLAEEVKARSQHWWWIAYEEVYLAIIRRNQGNIVEAFFHSFRAFEGIFAAWGHSKFNKHIETINGVPYLRDSILDDSEIALSTLSGKSKKAIEDIIKKLQNLKDKNQKREVEIEKDDRVEMNFRTLCNLLKAFRYADYNQNCKELKIFWDNDKQNNVSDKRNFIVHQVQGMSEEDLQKFWGVESQEELESKLRKFLNFIIKEDFPEGFESLKEASLMVKVHQALENAIASL